MALFRALILHAGSRQTPTCTFCRICHYILFAIVEAALAARCGTRIAAARRSCSTGEIAASIVGAAGTTLANADVAAARRLLATQEGVAVSVVALQGISGAIAVLAHWILVPIPCCAALAPRSCASVATARTSLLAWERIAIVVEAAQITLGLAAVTAALSITARELHAVAVLALVPALEEVGPWWGVGIRE